MDAIQNECILLFNAQRLRQLPLYFFLLVFYCIAITLWVFIEKEQVQESERMRGKRRKRENKTFTELRIDNCVKYFLQVENAANIYIIISLPLSLIMPHN